MAAVKAIFGLGNPGARYDKTRHNLGFMVVSALAKSLGASFGQCRYASAFVAEGRDEDSGKVLFAMPRTYMNESGQAVGSIVRYHKIALKDLIIVCDDINLPFGELRLRENGSDGGHNGLRSVFAHMGGSEIIRLRLGVGAPPAAHLQADYVLSEFNKEEKTRLEGFVEDAVGCLKLWLRGEVAQAMTQYNKRKAND